MRPHPLSTIDCSRLVDVVGGTSLRTSASALPDMKPALQAITDAVTQLKNQQSQSNPAMMMLLPMLMKKKQGG